jgi:hypothetical protein
MGERIRRPLFGAHGRKVVAFLCGWELVALVPGSPVPTISNVVDRHRWVGATLLFILGHHWFIEVAETIAAIADDALSLDVP